MIALIDRTLMLVLRLRELVIGTALTTIRAMISGMIANLYP